MTIIELKRYIYENKKIEFILEKLGCRQIKYNQYKEYYSASQNNGDNPHGVIIFNNEHLNYHSYTRQNISKQDLITLAEYSFNISFIEAIKYLHKILGFEYKYTKNKVETKKKIDPLDIFVKHKSKCLIDTSEIFTLKEELLNDYVPLLHINWYREGIMPWSRDKFGIAYSYKRKRIIIPLRHWMTGEIVGFNERTTIENYEELGIPKYFITPSYKKSNNIYGLWENYKTIQEAGYVVVFESEKSVMKRHSRNDGTGVAIQGHSISNEQVRILIGLNVNIVIAMDKDIRLEEVRYIAEKFYGIRNVSYIQDKYDLIGFKDSPADASNKIFQFLMKYKIKYDAEEHREYLKDLERKS